MKGQTAVTTVAYLIKLWGTLISNEAIQPKHNACIDN
jgi:hypothetical protein